ncbi:restriction endonuclease subunit S [Comamonas jiangduensis]|uniref:restriction endonuclease subunit S n=1 Tax=Comamonas jiangduensis TaxID=1194168 RepID=UPI0028A88D32|nr:restriction endonuclease subunit S [Comamonas jiangduensis]
MSFQRYPEYKDSGVEWLGEVPAHWGVLRLKNVLAQKVTDGPHTTPVFIDEGVPFLSVDGIQNGELVFDGCRFVSEDDHAEFKRKASPRRNDLLMGKAASTGKIARVKVDFDFSIWSPLALIRIDRNAALPEFVEYILKSKATQAEIDNYCTANTQKNISMDDIPRLILTHPPIEEQTAIATFLDHETAKIDALVAEQEKLIALLQEKRQAVISHAVTKGLNPNAPVKGSGVEWLGEVPEHWAVARLGYFATVENGTTPTRDMPEYWLDGEIPWLASGEVNKLHIFEAEEFITQTALKRCSLRLLPIDTVVVGLIGQGKTRGMSALLRTPATINQNLAAVCPGSMLNSWFLLYAFHAMYDWLREAGRGGNQAAMNCEMLRSLLVPVPNVDEQAEIVERINAALAGIDQLSVEAASATKLLQERRTALISAAVTGQIDVRGWVPAGEASIS